MFHSHKRFCENYTWCSRICFVGNPIIYWDVVGQDKTLGLFLLSQSSYSSIAKISFAPFVLPHLFQHFFKWNHFGVVGSIMGEFCIINKKEWKVPLAFEETKDMPYQFWERNYYPKLQPLHPCDGYVWIPSSTIMAPLEVSSSSVVLGLSC